MDAVFTTAFVICSGLLVRLWRENQKLVAARKRSAALMRRVKRDRDAREDSFRAASEVAVEEMAKNVELQAELVAYRMEDEKRERVGKEAWN